MTTHWKNLSGIIFAGVFLTAPLLARAEDAINILKKVDEVGHLESSKMQITQTVKTPSGDERTFVMMSYSKGGNDKGLTVYEEPSQVKNMKILTLNDGDDIWTYFPKTNRVRKIASSARNRKVQGSDFTYDDMATGKMATNWQGTVAGKETVDGVKCIKLALTPTASGPKSYSRAEAWIDGARYVTLRVVYYDGDGDKLKQLDISGYKKIKGVQVPMQFKMTNLTDGGSTIMTVNKAAINPELDGGMFTEAGLAK